MDEYPKTALETQQRNVCPEVLEATKAKEPEPKEPEKVWHVSVMALAGALR